MRSLTLRIYLTVVAALALFALVSGWVLQRHLDEQRTRFEGVAQERFAAWGELLQRSLPGADAPLAEQAEALRDWSDRLRLPLALDDAAGLRIGASDSVMRRGPGRSAMPGERSEDRAVGGPPPGMHAIRLNDGRTLWVLPPMPRRSPPGGRPPDGDRPHDAMMFRPPPGLPGVPEGLGLVALLVVLFVAVAAGAWPVARRLTRRLDAFKQGVEAFGAGALHQRVDQAGHDEIAALGASFNRTAGRIEALLRSHQSLLANASHELRSPLARLKMALAMVDDAPPGQRAALQREIDANIGELDALVEEVLLASRLDGAPEIERHERVDLLAVAAEEAARVQASVQGENLAVTGDERLLRRAVRNLLENARRYAGDEVEVTLCRAAGGVELRVCDRGPGVPEAYRERIFEPFFRLPGHAEREGGIGLGLALVRQIAERHGGSIRCEPRPGGGTCFTMLLPGVG